MASDSSTKALTTAIATGGLYALGQTAFRFGARRLGAFFFGGAYVGIVASLFLLFDTLTATPPPVASEVRGGCEEEASSHPPCMICQRSPSDFCCSETWDDAHAFCKSCFNVYAYQGLLDGGFYEQDETAPSGRISLAGELPCPMFGQGCRCASLRLTVLQNHLSKENQQLLDDAAERITMQLSLESSRCNGVRQRQFAS